MIRALLDDRRMRILLAGVTLSLLGDSALLVVLGVAAKDLTGSYAAGGLAYAGVVLPGLLAPVAGAAIDRFRRRTLLIWTCLISAAAILPLLGVNSPGTVWIIYLTSVSYGAASFFIDATLSGLFKAMVDPDLLAAVNGLMAAARQGLRIAGPVIGVIIYHYAGLAMVTLIDVATYLAAAAWAIKVSEPARAPEPFRPRALLAGGRHLAADRLLRLAVGGYAVSFLFVGFVATTLFAIASQELGKPAAFVGVLRAAQGAGAVLGGLTAAAVIRRLGELRVLGIGFTCFAAGQLGLLAGSVPGVLTALAGAYIGLVWASVACDTLVQRRTPSPLIGRAATAASACIALPQILSILAGAALIQHLGYRVLQVIMAGAVAAVGLSLASRSGHQMITLRDDARGRLGSSRGSPNMEDMSESHRRILLAKPRGYCAGVDRAVQAVEMALERYGPPVYVRKQIVHNTYVVRRLQERGAIFVSENDEVPEGSVVVFSAHGIAPEVRESAAERNLRTIDATCPLVTKVHNEARRFAAQDYDILLIGHEGHEEVVGTAGEAPARIRLVDGVEGAGKVEVRDPERLVWLSQTTLSVDETLETVTKLKQRFPGLIDPPSDDICYATQNRQAAVKVIAKDADVVIVVGSRNSSNSVRLVEVARDSGADAAYLVDDADELDPAWIAGASTIGVTSGASVPEALVTGLLDRLRELGFGEVEEVEAVSERMSFQLPRELRASR